MYAFLLAAESAIFEVLDQFAEWRVKGGSQPNQIQERQIALAALDAADVGPVQVGGKTEGLLRQATGRSEPPNRRTKFDELMFLRTHVRKL